MIRLRVRHRFGSWWAEVINTEPLPHLVFEPTPRATHEEAVADATRAWTVLG